MTALNDLLARQHDLRDQFDEETSSECRAYIQQEIYAVACQIEALERIESMPADVALDWDSVRIAALVMFGVVLSMIVAGPPW